ncbi:MAG: DinB family protein [Aridibacter famidurans]|nr:DinB family protein [Aridibacter famidurans]
MEEYSFEFSTVGEIYEANDRVRERLLSVVSGLTEEQEALRTEKGDWTVAAIVEHLAVVEEGMAKIANRLLKKAAEAGQASDGSAKISERTVEKAAEWNRGRFEAPDMVLPTGAVPVAESVAKMMVNREKLIELKETFENVDGTGFTFPHPMFGPLTAQEWLALIGSHETRHVTQIEKILNK